jgi:RNA polymerase sigma factor (sigma-70 family)
MPRCSGDYGVSDGQSAAIKKVFEARYADLLRYLAYRLPNPEDARDLAQEAFFRLLRRSRDALFQNPEAYLFRIAANLAYEQRLKHASESMPAEGIVDDRQPSPEARAYHQQRLERLERVLNGLPALPRAALVLQRRDGLTYAEIAAELNTTPHMVKKHIAAALLRCRERVSGLDDEI